MKPRSKLPTDIRELLTCSGVPAAFNHIFDDIDVELIFKTIKFAQTNFKFPGQFLKRWALISQLKNPKITCEFWRDLDQYHPHSYLKNNSGKKVEVEPEIRIKRNIIEFKKRKVQSGIV